ncbi:MAG: hypothetical protein Q9157_002369 [Trypethelium eluteriae]
MITVHYLGVSQSERITWLFEELGIPYKPASLKDLPGNDTGKAPFIEDSDANITLSESAAICDYVIHQYADGRLAAKPGDKHYADYLYWFHHENSNLQPAMVQAMYTRFVEDKESPTMQIMKSRFDMSMRNIDDKFKDNKWLAGEEFTAAEIMSVYSLTTQRYYTPVGLGDYKNILRWLGDCSNRDAYKRAMEKSDPEMKLLLSAEAPEKSLLETNGVTSNLWKRE